MRQPRILMCPPDYYGIEYEINPWMSRSRGSAPDKARTQWQALHDALAGLGVQLAEDQLAQQVGVDKGALIVKVVPNSAAAQAGLRGTRRDAQGRIVLGDIIVGVDGKPVASSKDLYNLLEARKVGDTVTLSIIREGQQLDVKATLQEGA